LAAQPILTLNHLQNSDAADSLVIKQGGGSEIFKVDSVGVVYAREGTGATVTLGSGGVPTVQLGVGGSQASVTSPADGQVQINGHNTTSQLIVQGQASQSSDYFDLIPNGTANPLFSVNNNGAVLAKNTTNSTTAFQVQNAAGSAALSVDTTPLNTRITNSSFEGSDVSMWLYNGTPGTVSRDTTQAYIGSRAAVQMP
jgi:hypothetical protein